MSSRFSSGFAFPFEVSATDCIILSKGSLDEGNINTPLKSLVKLGLFFISRAISTINTPFADDTTMQYLYGTVCVYLPF